MHGYVDDLGGRPPLHLDSGLKERIERKRTELERLGLLREAAELKWRKLSRLLLTYHSTGLEGNTLTLQDTHHVISSPDMLPGVPEYAQLEARNHAKAYDYSLTLANDGWGIGPETALRIHAVLMADLDSSAGNFRNGPAHIVGALVQPPPAESIEARLLGLLSWLKSAQAFYTPIVSAALAHYEFEAIHPFKDGNGRTGRLLLNMLLRQSGYPIALILREWRTRYIDALHVADTGDFQPLVNLVGEAVEVGLDNRLAASSIVE